MDHYVHRSIILLPNGPRANPRRKQDPSFPGMRPQGLVPASAGFPKGAVNLSAPSLGVLVPAGLPISCETNHYPRSH